MMGYLIKTQNGKVIAIDGGLKENSENLIKNIDDLGGHVDYWFLTHPHTDHVGAFMDVVRNTDVEIDHVLVTTNIDEWYEKNAGDRLEEIKDFLQVLREERINEFVEEVYLNEKIRIDNVDCEILGIVNPEIETNSINNASMVIKMTAYFKSVLFLADTGVESGEKLLNTQREKLKADIVQMAHHGQAGVSKEVYQEINPKSCLWPSTRWLWENDAGNGYDSGPWKTLEVRSWMQELGVKKHYIEKDGDIVIKW